MKVNFKSFNIHDLGVYFVVGVLFVVVIAIMGLFISPLLTTLIPTVFTTPLTLTEILLFLLLVIIAVRGL